MFTSFATLFVYFLALFAVAILSYRRQKSESDFIIGNRSLNFWLTALSAHASDMSSWLFLGYPALILVTGVSGAWAAIGLTVCMFLNWQFVAPKLRTITEQTNSLTLSAYFEARFADTSGYLRVVSAAMSILFFTFYISSGLVALGLLVESLLHFSYTAGMSLGIVIVVLYVFSGGYRTVAWIDLFQGFFLLGVIAFIPTILIFRTHGMGPILDAVSAQHLTTSLFPDFKVVTLFHLLLSALGWGLGYFGQPHILTKFMGIRQVRDLKKAKYLGISWQAIALTAATLIGLIGIYTFPQGLASATEQEKIVLYLVQETLPPFFAGLVLCAILAATTNVMAAQILVVASNLSEDFYKRIVRRRAGPVELLWISRSSVIFISSIAFLVAFFQISSIYELVLYSWSGLGASFGPLTLLSLYRKDINRYGAFTGILSGGLIAAIWPYFNARYQLGIPSIIVGFLVSIIAIQGVSFLTRKKCSLRNPHSH